MKLTLNSLRLLFQAKLSTKKKTYLKSGSHLYLILKTLFVLEIFKFLFWLFGHVEKTAG